MKERPILFNAPMVRAILDGSKGQTRRMLTFQPQNGWKFETPPVLGKITSPHPKKGKFGVFIRREIHPGSGKYELDLLACPYGQPGDRLWVRESARVMAVRGGIREIDIEYQADGTKATVKYPSRLAPAPLGNLLSNGTYREASRILLEITAIRAERLNDISESDAWNEGIDTEEALSMGCTDGAAVATFSALWEKINGQGSWDANPWVWVVEFKAVKP